MRACEQLQKFLEHEQASTHVIFASNSSKGQILRDHSIPLLVLASFGQFWNDTRASDLNHLCRLYVYTPRSVTPVISPLIKTITKFSILIGYQQPDLSINWAVAHVMLVILCALRCTLLSKLLGFSAFITTVLNRSELNRWLVCFSNFAIVLINW